MGGYFSVPGSIPAVNTQVQIVVQEIEAWRSSQRLDRFYICHNVLAEAGGGGYHPVFYRLLPLDADWTQPYLSRKWPNRCIPMVGLPPGEMLLHLFRQYLFVSFYRAFAQSLASENAARLMAMQAAEKNILETEAELQALYREQRQASITNELLDIVSGFEALSNEVFAI